MRKLLIALMMLAPAAFAAPAKKSAAPAAAPAEESRTSGPDYAATLQRLRGLSLYGMYNLADKVEGDGTQNGKSFSSTSSTENSFGLGAEFISPRSYYSLAFTGGVSYEFARTASKTSYTLANGTKIDTSYSGNKPELTLIDVYGQGDFAFTPAASVFAGVNYNFPSVRNVPGATVSGKLGYQFGGSYTFADHFAVDAMYRIINMSQSGDVSYDNQRMAGMIMRARYRF